MHTIRRISAACALAFLAMLVAVGVMGVPGMADYAPYIARGLCGAALICGIVYFSMRSHAPSGAMFSSGSVAASTSNKRFSDVAANANAKHSLLELCDYLKNPDKYRSLGAIMPRGVLSFPMPSRSATDGKPQKCMMFVGPVIRQASKSRRDSMSLARAASICSRIGIF